MPIDTPENAIRARERVFSEDKIAKVVHQPTIEAPQMAQSPPALAVRLDDTTLDCLTKHAADLCIEVEELAVRLLAGAATKLDGAMDRSTLTEGGNYRLNG